MILKASQRGRSAELAAHLLNGEENEHITVHEIRGFVSEDLAEALREAYAMSRGTRCKQFLFSVSLSPPETADVSVEDFEAAIEEIEKKMGLIDQPRIIVFHEKNGRRHCHAVWSRIDTEKLVAVNLAYFKRKLTEISTMLFLKHGWKLPKGFKRKADKSPLNMTRQEYRQAKRLLEDPQALKMMFKGAWEQSDSKETFARALQENGFLLARGDSRGFVAVDIKGGVYSLSRWIDIGTRDLKARLGMPENLPDIGQAKTYLASRMTENLTRYIAEAKTQGAEKRTPLVQELRILVTSQRKERQNLIEAQQTRWVQETRQRTARLNTGVAGVWQRVTGEYQKIRAINEVETKAGLARDQKELHNLIRSHLLERQHLQKTVLFYRDEHRVEVFRLRQEIARYVSTATEPPQPAAQAAAGKLPLAAQIAQLEGKISLLPADFLRQELARYTPAATEALPPAVAKADSVATVEKAPLAAQLAQIETKIALLSGDMTLLQASLESNLLSDEMRGRIRRMIEKTLEALQIKVIETKTEEQKAQEKTKEYQIKQAEFNQYVQRYAELQIKVEAERRQQEANRQFYSLINNMSYALNGLPNWQVRVMMPPPERQLDETAYVQKVVLQRDTAQLIQRVLYSAENESLVSRRPPIDPKTAVPALRQNVLEVKEMMARAGLRPPSGGGGNSRVAPATIRMTAATSLKTTTKFNQKR
ncbi:MAG: relaxase/mobilization nuclease domain-containing protein [Micavibrio sp.]|nr:relaxase/mobilization nuclease domain-containing protein [Micavibrio sp.]